MQSSPAGLLHYLQQIPDPRGRKGRRHSQAAMLAAIVAAMLCRMDGYEAVAQWVRSVPIAFWHALGGTRRPPCANSYRDLMNVVSPVALQSALTRWITEGLGLTIEDEDAAIIMDGKVLRGTRREHERTLQILAALDQMTGCVLSEMPVAADTNEAKQALEFLKGLVLQGKTVVGDAAFCQRDVCETIQETGGEYFVLVKDNQPTLHRDAVQAFVIPEGFSPLGQTQSA